MKDGDHLELSSKHYDSDARVNRAECPGETHGSMWGRDSLWAETDWNQ